MTTSAPDFEKMARKILGPFEDPTDPLWRSSLKMAAEQLRQVWNARDELLNASRLAVDDLLKALKDLTSHEYAEQCQECGIGKSDAWRNAKSVITTIESYELRSWWLQEI